MLSYRRRLVVSKRSRCLVKFLCNFNEKYFTRRGFSVVIKAMIHIYGINTELFFPRATLPVILLINYI